MRIGLQTSKRYPANISSGNHHPPRLNHVHISGNTPFTIFLGSAPCPLTTAIKINRALILWVLGFKSSALLLRAETCRKCQEGGKYTYGIRNKQNG